MDNEHQVFQEEADQQNNNENHDEQQDEDDNIHDENANMPNQQHQEPVLLQPPILQDDDIINDDQGDIPNNGQLHQQLQEAVLQHGGNGHIPNGNQPHQQHDPDIMQIRYFQIMLYHYPLPQHEEAVQEGHHIPQIVGPITLPYWPAAFVVAKRHGPGPYTAVVVSMIPLYLCDNFNDFIARLWESYEQAVGEALHNPTVENPMPGYLLTYYLVEPQDQVVDFNGIPWQEFRVRLALVTAWEL